jgi:hypothetical protein
VWRTVDFSVNAALNQSRTRSVCSPDPEELADVCGQSSKSMERFEPTDTWKYFANFVLPNEQDDSLFSMQLISGGLTQPVRFSERVQCRGSYYVIFHPAFETLSAARKTSKRCTMPKSKTKRTAESQNRALRCLRPADSKSFGARGEPCQAESSIAS